MKLRAVVSLALAAALAGAACGGDDGATVRNLDGSGAESGSASGSGSGSASGSGSGSASGSASGPASGSESPAASGTIGAYTPVSDVAPHAAVVEDVCDVNDLLPSDGEPDVEGIRTIYTEGAHSENSDGSMRTLAGFATSDHAGEPRWDAYVDRFGAGWLDAFVTAALDGAGAFEGESGAVRRQGIQKGIQNQIMVAWMLHEMDAAAAKVAEGDIDPASGAPHNVDEAWAFYHGTAPDCAPYATADKRGEDFGVGSSVNDALLAAVEDARDAAVAGDADAYAAADAEVERQLLITYLQATHKYAVQTAADVEAGDAEAARTHQAEGWAFWRVAEPFVAAVDTGAADTVAAALSLDAEPSADIAEQVLPALEGVYDDLGIDPAEIGSFDA